MSGNKVWTFLPSCRKWLVYRIAFPRILSLGLPVYLRRGFACKSGAFFVSFLVNNKPKEKELQK
jgi:hypothetical protein